MLQIGNHYVVDPTPEEESCSSSGLVVSVSPNRKITAVRKIGSGSLHPESLSSMLKVFFTLCLGQVHDIFFLVRRQITVKIIIVYPLDWSRHRFSYELYFGG